MINRLKKRWEFLEMQKGPSAACGSLIVRKLKRDDFLEQRVGFTATKKLGKANVRNRAKRRMRALAELFLPLHGQPGHNYILIARSGIIERSAFDLETDLKTCLKKLEKQ